MMLHLLDNRCNTARQERLMAARCVIQESMPRCRLFLAIAHDLDVPGNLVSMDVDETVDCLADGGSTLSTVRALVPCHSACVLNDAHVCRVHHCDTLDTSHVVGTPCGQGEVHTAWPWIPSLTVELRPCAGREHLHGRRLVRKQWGCSRLEFWRSKYSLALLPRYPDAKYV